MAGVVVVSENWLCWLPTAGSYLHHGLEYGNRWELCDNVGVVVRMSPNAAVQLHPEPVLWFHNGGYLSNGDLF